MTKKIKMMTMMMKMQMMIKMKAHVKMMMERIMMMKRETEVTIKMELEMEMQRNHRKQYETKVTSPNGPNPGDGPGTDPPLTRFPTLPTLTQRRRSLENPQSIACGNKKSIYKPTEIKTRSVQSMHLGLCSHAKPARRCILF